MMTRLIPILVAATALVSGCYAHGHAHLHGTYRAPSYVAVTAAPPPLQAEVTVRPAQPAGSVWVHGHWKWEANGWVWVGGAWSSPPQAGQVWTAPEVEESGGTYRYHPGHWRPAGARVRARGTVVVSHGHGHGHPPHGRPAQPRVVDVPPVSGGATSGGAAPAPAGTTTTGGGTVTATGSGTFTAGGGGSAHTAPVPAASGGGTVTARPTGTVTTGSGRTPSRPTVTTRPGGTTEPARPTGTVTATGSGTVTGSSGRVTPSGTVVPARSPSDTTSPPNRPTGTVTAMGAGTVTGRVRAGALRCSVNTARAPRGGLITVRGNGFGNNAVVRVGGQTAAIVNRTGSQLRAQVPRASAGGMVSVVAGNRSANCGRLQIVGGR